MNRSDEALITDEHVQSAEGYENLGPAYFAARDIAQRYMEKFKGEHFTPLVAEFASKFRDKIWGDVDDFLVGDTESNLHSQIWRMVDEVVLAILGKHEWAYKKYALGSKYDCEEIREKVAKLIPKEIQDARIADLENEVKDLKKSLEWARRDR